MDSYNNSDRLYLASSEEGRHLYEIGQTTSSLSSEPLDRFILELRRDLKAELKEIARIKWE